MKNGQYKEGIWENDRRLKWLDDDNSMSMTATRNQDFVDQTVSYRGT
jgi:hypothetical protein